MIEKMLITEKKTAENNSQYVYRLLRENIMSLVLFPGEILSEQAICQMLGVSRTPVHEALMRLRGERLVDVASQSKTSVSLIDIRQCAEGQFIRMTLEAEVYRKLCDMPFDRYLTPLEANLQMQEFYAVREDSTAQFLKLDNEFHAILFNAAECSLTWNLICQANTHYDRARLFFNRKEPQNLPQVAREHRHILEALRNHDKEEVMKDVELHTFRFSPEEHSALSRRIAEMIFENQEAFSNIPKHYRNYL
ncbi:MAG: GntR family transcriptional regulator [Lachnospiraceae bacterium]|nr:GntR family transcriptional regulator [Lachnospiraceae bacterium]